MAVTRNDVARAAGVSTAVVSYVLNNGPRHVAPATRQRVLDVIAELGYRRDVVARAMKTGSTDSVGLVLPEITPSYFAGMAQQITNAAGACGLSVTVATSNGDVKVERGHVAELAQRRVNGVILFSLEPSQDFSWAGELGVPLLVLDRPRAAEEGATAASHLAEHGCRRIARVFAPQYAFVQQRDLGVARALRERGVVGDDAELVVHVEASEKGGYLAARQLLSLSPRPDGAIIDNPRQVTGFLRGATDLGFSVPEDIAVVGYDLDTHAEFTIPRMSSIDINVGEFAARAIEMIRNATPGDGLLIMREQGFSFTPRESCGHRPLPA
ncbi:LacI family DNA-binding transcriptional regulator [Streptomyces acidicola]|uniref:LacI family DNA-binding transcriptional regulator n=1 Tax=Streptomyces acidicola TaxID=2596892 RepID=UPI00381F534F